MKLLDFVKVHDVMKWESSQFLPKVDFSRDAGTT
jgi:hypothetical protein